ncbi:MAG: taurine ABC transporter substrate-binding protein [Alphaproteobacteria bacterium]|nr:taurine ABC transporter substrate-binding protein [Alphaproteobacteria bacterium]
MPDLTITMALELYDRHMPFFLGTVAPPPGIHVTALEVGMAPPRRHGIDRHGRMLKGEFDVAEMSLASYIVARERGRAMTAIPVFPRRLFSQNHIFVNTTKGIRTPRDLVGRKVGIWAFQVTMSVLAKGDLKTEYGVPWEEIHWVAHHAEEIPLDLPGVSLTRAPAGRDIGEMLLAGEIDALIYPHPPPSVLSGDPRIGRLFADAPAECMRHKAKTGWFPIMHLIAMKPEIVERAPHLPKALIAMWEAAKHQALDYYTDPGFAWLAFARNQFEAERSGLGADPWPPGLARNRANLARFLDYCRDQRLIKSAMTVESLFHPSVLDS